MTPTTAYVLTPSFAVKVCSATHAEPPRQAAQGRPRHREAGQRVGEGAEAPQGHDEGPRGRRLRRGAPAAGGFRPARGRGIRRAAQGSGEEGRGADAVGARLAPASARRGEPGARAPRRGQLPLREAERKDRKARNLAGHGEAARERRGGGGGGPRPA